MKKIYLLMGPPGSGKTTQANEISEIKKIKYISWGKISREILAGKGKYKKKKKIVYDIMKNNDYFPKYFISNILEEEILESDTDVIIDGFPRRISEAKELLEICDRNNLEIESVINLNGDLEVLKERTVNRLYCGECNSSCKGRNDGKIIYCQFDGSRLLLRKDDGSHLFERRMREYSEDTLPVFDFLAPIAKHIVQIEFSKNKKVILHEIINGIENNKKKFHLYKKIEEAVLPTDFGYFKIVGYRNKVDYSIHLAIVKGDVYGEENVLTRVHSSCITGDIFHSKKCDCGQQLEASFEMIERAGKGVVLYLFQEGRGINIINKIRAYKLQEEGKDTVESNELLGLPAEMRNYDVVSDIVKDLNVKSIDLVTNNPDKVKKISSAGVLIKNRVPLVIKSNKHNKEYLAAKKIKMNHLY